MVFSHIWYLDSPKSVLMTLDIFPKNIGKVNCGRTLLFNGADDHKVPSTSKALTDGDLYRVAGRAIGHSFIHRGPCFTGLSPSML